MDKVKVEDCKYGGVSVEAIGYGKCNGLLSLFPEMRTSLNACAGQTVEIGTREQFEAELREKLGAPEGVDIVGWVVGTFDRLKEEKERVDDQLYEWCLRKEKLQRRIAELEKQLAGKPGESRRVVERWFVRLGEVNSEGNRPAGYAYSEASDEEEFEAIPADLAEDIRRYFHEHISSGGEPSRLCSQPRRELAASIKRRLEGEA